MTCGITELHMLPEQSETFSYSVSIHSKAFTFRAIHNPTPQIPSHQIQIVESPSNDSDKPAPRNSHKVIHIDSQ
ncbi:hypothetical protein RJT34_24169 [Clitoria ternatea]|uniref:Uncharacterized protein n=1 Tax=Clitoria ternatea TaxID=43366 RepID=A0AAN9FP54_CLITE